MLFIRGFRKDPKTAVKGDGMQALDRQALFVAQAIRDVAAELEHRREALRGESEDAALRTRAVDDVDRLANLVSLANSLPLKDLEPNTRRALQETLDELRRRISRLGTALTIGRIRDLRDTAECSASRHEHPLGKSYILRDQFLRYLGYLVGLAEGLTPEHEADVRSAAAAINVLIAGDTQRWALDSFGGDADPAPINMDALAFQPLDDDPSDIEHAA